MAGLRIAVLMMACMVALASASPLFFKPKHEHVVIHVPYKVHTHHHHHIEKVHVPVVKHVPVYKHVPYPVHVPVYKEVHFDHHHHDHHDHHDSASFEHGGWW